MPCFELEAKIFLQNQPLNKDNITFPLCITNKLITIVLSHIYMNKITYVSKMQYFKQHVCYKKKPCMCKWVHLTQLVEFYQMSQCSKTH